jgi:hypothetical protein
MTNDTSARPDTANIEAQLRVLQRGLEDLSNAVITVPPVKREIEPEHKDWDLLRVRASDLSYTASMLARAVDSLCTAVEWSRSDNSDCYYGPEQEATDLTVLRRLTQHASTALGFIHHEVGQIEQLLDEMTEAVPQRATALGWDGKESTVHDSFPGARSRAAGEDVESMQSWLDRNRPEGGTLATPSGVEPEAGETMQRLERVEQEITAMRSEVRTRHLVVEDEAGFERVVATSSIVRALEPGVHVFAKSEEGRDRSRASLWASDGDDDGPEAVGMTLWGRGDAYLDVEARQMEPSPITGDDRFHAQAVVHNDWDHPAVVLDAEGLSSHPMRQHRESSAQDAYEREIQAARLATSGSRKP